MPTFGRVTPTIPVKDIQRALQFFRDTLGFTVTFTNGTPISFAIINQGAARLHLAERPDEAGPVHVHIMVDDLDAVHDLVRAAGVAIRQPPKVQQWGLRDIVIADFDGNTYELAEQI
jgi:catechol 2,3-dioxygenase-like lactoylglutathione lyase family enzyme